MNVNLPHWVVCNRCGAEAIVPRQSIDENASAGQLPGFDQAWREGFWYTIDCPVCGRREQRLTPPRP